MKKSLDVKRYQYNKADRARDTTSPSVIMINYIVEGIDVLNEIFLEKGLVEKILMDNSMTFHSEILEEMLDKFLGHKERRLREFDIHRAY